MFKIKIGDKLKVKEAKTGEGKRGTYTYITVEHDEDEKHKYKANIFLVDEQAGIAVRSGDIVEIVGMEMAYSRRLNEGTNKWEGIWNPNIKIAIDTQVENTFTEVGDSNEDIPF